MTSPSINSANRAIDLSGTTPVGIHPEIAQNPGTTPPTAKKTVNTGGVTGSGYASISGDSTHGPKGKVTDVKRITVGGNLIGNVGDVTVQVGGGFREKITNGNKTVEFLADASAKFATPLGQATVQGAAKLDCRTGVWELSPGASLTFKTPTGDVKIAGATTFNMQTGLMTKNNVQISLDLNKQTAFVYERTFDKKTTQDAVGMTYKFNDPALKKLQLTVLGTRNQDTGELGVETRAKLNITPTTILEGSFNTNYNNDGSRGIVQLRQNF